jgi:hypothetical protein
MHAVIVYQHYLYYLQTGKDKQNHEMLDLSWSIRECFPNKKLKKFLESGGGGSAIEFFCEIKGTNHEDVRSVTTMLPKKSIAERKFKWAMRNILKDFKSSNEHTLVSEFKIEKGFKTPGKSKYDGEVDDKAFYDYGKECGSQCGVWVLYSMVLLGLCKDDEQTEKVWFLLQNSWAPKYLVIVSGEYLASCGARITFIEPHQSVSLIENMEVIDAHYVETKISPEGASPEEY